MGKGIGRIIGEVRMTNDELRSTNDELRFTMSLGFGTYINIWVYSKD